MMANAIATKVMPRVVSAGMMKVLEKSVSRNALLSKTIMDQPHLASRFVLSRFRTENRCTLFLEPLLANGLADIAILQMPFLQDLVVFAILLQGRHRGADGIM